MDQTQQLVISDFNNEDSEKKIFIGARSGTDLLCSPNGNGTRLRTPRPSVSEIIPAAVSQTVKQHQEIQEQFMCRDQAKLAQLPSGERDQIRNESAEQTFGLADEKELSQVLKEIYKEMKNTKTYPETTATKESSIPLSNE